MGFETENIVTLNTPILGVVCHPEARNW